MVRAAGEVTRPTRRRNLGKVVDQIVGDTVHRLVAQSGRGAAWLRLLNHDQAVAALELIEREQVHVALVPCACA